jgi:stress response protein SCP2
MIDLKKGQRVKLQEAIDPSMPFALEIGIKGNAVYDFSCFGLNSSEKCPKEEHFVFYNNLSCPNNAVILRGATNPAVFDINLSNPPADIIKLAFTATIDDNSTMGQISQCNIAIKQNNAACFQMQMSGSDFENQRAIIAIEIYKKDVWRLSAVGNGFDGGLSELLKLYGLEEADGSGTSSDSGQPPTPSPQPESPPPPRPQTPPTGGRHGQDTQKTYKKVCVDGKEGDAYKYDGEEFIKDYKGKDWV